MLTIENLTKNYGEKKAVDNLSLHIAGIMDFDEGEIKIDGFSAKENSLECKKHMAYIPDNPDLYDFMTGIKYLNFVADIFGVDEKTREERIHKYADMFELTESLAQPISAYSHGMKQKLAIISAWIHEPKLLQSLATKAFAEL